MNNLLSQVKSTLSNMKGRLLPTLAAGTVGLFAFIGVQIAVGQKKTIAQFIGDSIVKQGGYDPSLSALFGWGVHSLVSFSYALLLVALISIPLFHTSKVRRWGVGLTAALVLGVVTTIISGPAISVTISLLAAKGLPMKYFPLYLKAGTALWNHILFFAIIWFGGIVAPDLAKREPASRMELGLVH